ncbi:MAG: ABC transporter permease [Desulfobacteraceae bacterium]|nr:ABC transporter permease [Desulfobacteraceae bacterium]
MWNRIWTIAKARIIEFYRDRSALGWNLLFPFLIIAGFSTMFAGGGNTLFTVGVLGAKLPGAGPVAPQYRNLREAPTAKLVPFASRKEALDGLARHRLDLVIDPGSGRYWLDRASARGRTLERLLFTRMPAATAGQPLSMPPVSYLEWLFPGVLAMNMMFSALYGVGYVVVRYRKNGVLKRLSVTPTRPWEFLTAQIISRLIVLLASTGTVFAGCSLLYGFKTRGSYLDLVLVFAVGGFCLIALGLVVASRSSSEEFAEGLLNLIALPMMFLSEVWFSLEGARPWVRQISRFFPLTYIVEGARMVMNEGAGLFELKYHLLALALMAVLFLAVGSKLFTWQRE